MEVLDFDLVGVVRVVPCIRSAVILMMGEQSMAFRGHMKI